MSALTIPSKALFQRSLVIQRQFILHQRSIASTQRELLSCGLSPKEANEFLLTTMRLKVWD